MRVVDGNVQDTLRRAQGFMDKNGVVLGPINQSGARTELDDLVAELSGHAVAQDAGDLEARGAGGSAAVRHV